MSVHVIDCLLSLRWKPFFALMCSEIEEEVGPQAHDYEVLNAAALWLMQTLPLDDAKGALAELFLRWLMPRLLNVLSQEDAEDINSVALAKFIEIWPKEMERENSKATLLLRVIADRKVVDLIRTTNGPTRMPSGGFVTLDDEAAQNVVPANENPFSNEIIQSLDECIAGLPLPLRTLLVSRHLQYISYDVLAQLEGITGTALRKRLSRAVGQVKLCIESKLDDGS